MFEEDNYEYTLRCKICRDSFIFKKEATIFSKWIDHIKSHYIDKDLVKKEWIAKDIIHINYDSVIEITSSVLDTNSDAQHSVTYRELTQRAGDAYRNALHRTRNEATKSKLFIFTIILLHILHLYSPFSIRMTSSPNCSFGFS